MDWKEIIGIVASCFVLFSLTFNSVSVKNNIIMRSLNLSGSVVFVVYGVLISAWSIVICNSLLAIFNTYHIVKLCIKLAKSKNSTEAEQTEQPEQPQKQS